MAIYQISITKLSHFVASNESTDPPYFVLLLMEERIGLKQVRLEDFSYRILGTGCKRRLVFLHGLMGFASNWMTIARALDREFEILLLDQRGHGRSFKPQFGYSPEDYASDLKQIVDELGWRKFDLVGHSMGGRNALCYTHLHPQYVNTLVIEDIGPEANPQSLPFIQKLLDDVPLPFGSRKEAKDYFDQSLNGNMVFGEYLLANLKKGADGKLTWRFYAPGILESVMKGRLQDRWEEIRGLNVPTLVIRGSQSDELSRATLEQMVEMNPRVSAVEVSGAGHWVHFEQPLAFIRELRRFWGLELATH